MSRHHVQISANFCNSILNMPLAVSVHLENCWEYVLEGKKNPIVGKMGIPQHFPMNEIGVANLKIPNFSSAGDPAPFETPTVPLQVLTLLPLGCGLLIPTEHRSSKDACNPHPPNLGRFRLNVYYPGCSKADLQTWVAIPTFLLKIQAATRWKARSCLRKESRALSHRISFQGLEFFHLPFRVTTRKKIKQKQYSQVRALITPG